MAQALASRRFQATLSSRASSRSSVAAYAAASMSSGRNGRPTEPASTPKPKTSQLQSRSSHDPAVEPIVWLRPLSEWFQPASRHEEEEWISDLRNRGVDVSSFVDQAHQGHGMFVSHLAERMASAGSESSH